VNKHRKCHKQNKKITCDCHRKNTHSAVGIYVHTTQGHHIKTSSQRSNLQPSCPLYIIRSGDLPANTMASAERVGHSQFSQAAGVVDS
jgi:hypothetical protein